MAFEGEMDNPFGGAGGRGGKGAKGGREGGGMRGHPGGCARPGNSFVAGTLVLMADGTSKPIEQVQAGDIVLATDPETGRTEPEVVLTPITGKGSRNLVEITVDTGSETGKLIATDNHPFWVPDLRKWTTAGELRAGSLLQTSAGTSIQVTAVRKWTAYQRVHNLAVNDIHTYYALARTTPVLVHNDRNGICDTAGELGNLKDGQGGFRDPEQAADLAKLSDEDLIRSFNDPLDGDVVLVLPDGTQWAAITVSTSSGGESRTVGSIRAHQFVSKYLIRASTRAVRRMCG